ncbi:MAG: hypothetical protein M3442_21885, partial [Chloroflexota bacterium]|nr:hypothetical protein [Chloroflexota bacterium]
MARPRNRTAGIGLTGGWRGSYVRWAPRAAFAMGVLWLLPPAAIVGLGAVAGSERLRIAGITILPLPAAPGEGGVFSGMLLLFVGEFAFVRLEANAGAALVIGVGTV